MVKANGHLFFGSSARRATAFSAVGRHASLQFFGSGRAVVCLHTISDEVLARRNRTHGS